MNLWDRNFLFICHQRHSEVWTLFQVQFLNKSTEILVFGNVNFIKELEIEISLLEILILLDNILERMPLVSSNQSEVERTCHANIAHEVIVNWFRFNIIKKFVGMNWCGWASSKQLCHGIHQLLGTFAGCWIILLDNDILFAHLLSLSKNVHPLSPGGFMKKLTFFLVTIIIIYFPIFLGFLKVKCLICNIHDQIDEFWSNLNIEVPLPCILDFSSDLVFFFCLCKVWLPIIFSFDCGSFHLLFDLLSSFNTLFLLGRCLWLAVHDDDTFTKLLSLTGYGLILLLSLAL